MREVCQIKRMHSSETNKNQPVMDPETHLVVGNNKTPPLRELRVATTNQVVEYLYMENPFLSQILAGTATLEQLVKAVKSEALYSPAYSQYKRRAFWLRYVEADLTKGKFVVLLCVAEVPDEPCKSLSSIDHPMILERQVAQPTGMSCYGKKEKEPLTSMEDLHTIPGVNRLFSSREDAKRHLQAMMMTKKTGP